MLDGLTFKSSVMEPLDHKNIPPDCDGEFNDRIASNSATSPSQIVTSATEIEGAGIMSINAVASTGEQPPKVYVTVYEVGINGFSFID